MIMLPKSVTLWSACQCSQCRGATPHRQKKGAGRQSAAHLRGGLLRSGSPRSTFQFNSTWRVPQANPRCITMGIVTSDVTPSPVQAGDAA
jgi:hypothetical protein